MANEDRNRKRTNNRRDNDYGRETIQQHNERGKSIDNMRPDEDDQAQSPLYEDEQQINPFWQELTDNLNGKQRAYQFSRDRSSHVNPNTGTLWEKDNSDSNDRSPYDDNSDVHELRRLENGSYISYTGSTMQNHGGDYEPVLKNSLNIMDYAEHRGFDYKLQRGEKGVEYRLQWGASGPNSSDFDSTYVALNPHPYYYDKNGQEHLRAHAKDKDGNVIKDDDGKPKDAMVTGKGAFVRFSKSDLGQGSAGDNLIRFIMQVNGYTKEKDAYKELNRTVKEYGSETRFNTADPDASIPQNSEGRDYTYVHHGKDIAPQRRRNASINRHAKVDNPYEKAVSLGHNILMNTKLGEAAHKRFKELGVTDRQIKEDKLGWLPGKDSGQGNYLTKLLKNGKLYGMGVNSHLTAIDEQGNGFDRFGGKFIAARTQKNGKIVGLKGYDYDSGKKVQDVRNTKVADYDRNYGTPTPYGFNKNGPNPKWVDQGAKHSYNNERYKKFAMGYLTKQRGISSQMAEYLWKQDLVRVGMGRKGNPDDQKKIAHAHKVVDAINQDKDGYKKKYGAGRINKALMHYNQGVIHNSYVRNGANGYPAYVEFAHKLVDGKNQDLEPGRQDTVGSDRIQFDPAHRDSYRPFKDEPKTIGFNSMHNYGFNFSTGHKQSDAKRKLYIFESPLDAISYADTHRKELRNSHQPCDFLSLGGSGAKTKVINNYMHHKVDDTGERYDKVIFGTDNDPKGQNVPARYTEKARLQMPKSAMDAHFEVVTAPHGKDWNDTSQHYAIHGKSDRDQNIKTHYKMSEFIPKVIHDNIHGMTEYGRKQFNKIMSRSNKLYTQYINNGAQAGTSFDDKDNQYIRQAKANMKRNDTQSHTQDRNIYERFLNNVGRAFKPQEILAGAAMTSPYADDYDQKIDRTRTMGLKADNISKEAEPAQETNEPESSESPHKESPSQADTDSENEEPSSMETSHDESKQDRAMSDDPKSQDDSSGSPTSSSNDGFVYKTKPFPDDTTADMGSSHPSEGRTQNDKHESSNDDRSEQDDSKVDSNDTSKKPEHHGDDPDPLGNMGDSHNMLNELDKGNKSKLVSNPVSRKKYNYDHTSLKGFDQSSKKDNSPKKKDEPKGSSNDEAGKGPKDDKQKKRKRNRHFGGPKL